MSSSAIGSVIIAAASAVCKVAIIGSAGFYAVKRPKGNPFLPIESVSMVSRMSFAILSLPLIYTGIAANISLDQLGSLWFMIVAAIIVIGSSYCVASLLGSRLCPCFGMNTSPDLDALRISAAFPNILAIPILVFPTLCEYEVVYDAFGRNPDDTSSNDVSRQSLIQTCKQKSNAMVFAYFFAWSLLFWTVGNQLLIRAGKVRQEYQTHNTPEQDQEQEQVIPTNVDTNVDNNIDQHSLPPPPPTSSSSNFSFFKIIQPILSKIKAIIQPVVQSSGFIAMMLGLITACIRPLQSALFSTGGYLRFLGSALETLGNSAPSLTCIIVAASLAVVQTKTQQPEPITQENASTLLDHTHHNNRFASLIANDLELPISKRQNVTSSIVHSIRRRSSLFLVSIRRSPTLRMHIWYNLSRLILSPALAFVIVMALDCSGYLSSLPPLGKLVILVNSACPGALIVVVVLKAQGLSESASVVARIYLPSYLLSIITIAGWTAVGLMVSIPGGEERFCKAFIKHG